VEIADEADDRAAEVEEVVVAVDDPAVVVVDAVVMVDRDTKSKAIQRPRVRSRPFLLSYHSRLLLLPQRTQKEWATLHHIYRRLSVCGSGWIRTRNSSGASCLKWISSSVEISCTRDKGSSSEKVQWQDT
jgi:hypothetical protein